MQKTEENKDLLKFNAEGIHPADMFLNAKDKAVKAVDDFVKEHGEPLYCGFANVSIHPARGRLVSFLKKAGVGDNGFRGGYRISYYTQSMDIKETACEAFRDELRKYGLTVYAESRAD